MSATLKRGLDLTGLLWTWFQNKFRCVSTSTEIKGPDNPTSQLLPILSFKGCSGDGEGRKDKGGGERLCVKVCEKIVCMYVYVCMYARTYVCMYVRTYVCMYVYVYVCDKVAR